MTNQTTDFAFPLTDAPDSGGGGGFGGDVSGGEPVAAPEAPSPIDVSDDTLIKVGGSDKPVKFSDYRNGFQSQFTKASQRAAELERALEAERQRVRQFEQERQRGRQENQPDPYAQIAELPYLTGQDTVGILKQFDSALRQRDQVILAMAQKLQQMGTQFGGLHENHVNAAFEAKIGRWLKEGGYPEEAAELAKDIYLAYTGDDLDEQFPQIFKERWEQVQRAIEAQKARALAATRRQAFVPGRGGQGQASKPLQLDPRASAAQTANELWESLQRSGT